MTKKKFEALYKELNDIYKNNMDNKDFQKDEDGENGYSLNNCMSNMLYNMEFIIHEMERLNINKIN